MILQENGGIDELGVAWNGYLIHMKLTTVWYASLALTSLILTNSMSSWTACLFLDHHPIGCSLRHALSYSWIYHFTTLLGMSF